MYSEIKFGKRKLLNNFKKINIISKYKIEIELNLDIDDIYPKNNNIKFEIKNLPKNIIKKINFTAENKFNINKVNVLDRHNNCFLIEKND
jgi:hypothetical protein